METREELKKKIKLYDKLGAKAFQPVVLKVEEWKFRLLKDIFPSSQTRYEKHCQKKRDKALSKAKTDEERKTIIENYRKLILAWRTELAREQNRNYHMDERKPTEILQYLEWNKSQHIKGLIKNGAITAAAIGAIILGFGVPIAATVIGLEAVSAFINFQCVNIQNSHICKYKLVEDRLKKKEERGNRKRFEEYGAAAGVYQRTIEKSKEVPTLDEMIQQVRTPEEAEQLRKMILARLATRQGTTPQPPTPTQDVREEQASQLVEMMAEYTPDQQTSETQKKIGGK